MLDYDHDQDKNRTFRGKDAHNSIPVKNFCALEITTTFSLLLLAAWISAVDVELYEIVNPSTNKLLLFQRLVSVIFFNLLQFLAQSKHSINVQRVTGSRTAAL